MLIVMGSRTTVTQFDDVDGTEGEDIQTVTLSLDGQSVEIDLSEKNREALSKALAPYLEAGRRPSSNGAVSRRRRSSAPASSGGSVDTKAVRAWAEENGVTVSPRGRISASVIEQYTAAQN